LEKPGFCLKQNGLPALRSLAIGGVVVHHGAGAKTD
jgi:hypothetical protein